jgi:hypothetical protein
MNTANRLHSLNVNPPVLSESVRKKFIIYSVGGNQGMGLRAL